MLKRIRGPEKGGYGGGEMGQAKTEEKRENREKAKKNIACRR